jgi:hypothetical protein
MRRQVGADTRPGIVVSVATSGDLCADCGRAGLDLEEMGFENLGCVPALRRTLARNDVFERLIGSRANTWRNVGGSTRLPAVCARS